MATTPNSVITVQTPNRGIYSYAAANAGTFETLYTGGAAGSKITGILVSSNDTSAQSVQVAITNGGTNYILNTTNVPITAGQVAGTTPVNLISPANCPGLPIDSDGNPYLFLATASDTLTVNVVAMTAAKAMKFMCVGGDF